MEGVGEEKTLVVGTGRFGTFAHVNHLITTMDLGVTAVAALASLNSIR